ncbi:MAG: DEAD/DEAH box helicase, partial [Nocardioides sp.]
HKAYLHRSGRTARAGARGTVVTLMTSEQVRDVRQLTRAAGIAPRTTRIDGIAHPVLEELAPGERVKVAGGLVVEAPGRTGASDGTGSGTGGGSRGRGGSARGRSGSRNRRGRSGSGQSQAKGQPRSGGRSRGGRPNGGGSTHSAAGFSSGRR